LGHGRLAERQARRIEPWRGSNSCAAGHPPDIYLFCDSSHLARPDFAATLAAPLARGEAVLASGFHRVVPLDFSPGTLAMLVTCLGLHMLQSIRPLTQPWGGAMAMSRAAFEEYGIAALWAENIVDDCSMAAFLRKKGVVCLPVAGAILDTPLAGMGLGRFGDWLTRQLLYLKFCFPGTWLGAVPAALAISLAPVAAVVVLAGGRAGACPAAARGGAGRLPGRASRRGAGLSGLFASACPVSGLQRRLSGHHLA
jgi:hypothetical protein